MLVDVAGKLCLVAVVICDCMMLTFSAPSQVRELESRNVNAF